MGIFTKFLIIVMAWSRFLSASANPAPISPEEIRNIVGNKFSQLRTMPITHTNTLFSTSFKNDTSLTQHAEFMDNIRIKQESILKEAKHALRMKSEEDEMEALDMIDVIQKLGLEYHFEDEIETCLRKQNLIFMSHPSEGGLYEVALQFRLLRQGSYNVPTEVFNNFMDKNWKIKEKFTEDIMGLIEFYEASQLSVEGEDNLDEAGEMSRQFLDAWSSKHSDPYLGAIVSNVLQLPFHKSSSRFSNYSNYIQFKANKGRKWTGTLQELAEVDSYLVKSMHQEEILQVSRWWNDLGLAKELKFVRDEPFRWYMWTMACLKNPKFSEERIELTKPMSLVYIIDDVFDVHGSIDTLTLFTDAVNRWELEATEQLPEHLKICFKTLYDITNEFAYKVYTRHGSNPINSLQKLWARLCNAFLVEAQWLTSGHLPKAEEYLKNGVTTTGVQVVLGHTMFLLEHGMTKEIATLLDNNPGIMSAVATILRLYDDLEGTMDDKGGYDGSYLKCYMKEYHGISDEETKSM